MTDRISVELEAGDWDEIVQILAEHWDGLPPKWVEEIITEIEDQL
jgi:hypothetical protein